MGINFGTTYLHTYIQLELSWSGGLLLLAAEDFEGSGCYASPCTWEGRRTAYNSLFKSVKLFIQILSDWTGVNMFEPYAATIIFRPFLYIVWRGYTALYSHSGVARGVLGVLKHMHPPFSLQNAPVRGEQLYGN